MNQLPQPIVPLDFYERCREPLRSHQAQAAGNLEAQAQDAGDFDQSAAIATYQRLITELPPLNRQLLLYILDLLAVFASKSDLNRMNSANLAAIFQPGMLSHPSHDMKPHEYRLSQDVLIFLIENQDSFLIGMNGTAADEKTVKEVQSGIPPPRQSHSPSTPRNSPAGLGRSASNASAGADSLRRFGGIRRNVSVSSKNSKTSMNVPSPVSPSPGSPYLGNAGNGVSVQRSNTLPSKKSPGIPPSRFSRPTESPTSTPSTLAAGNYVTSKTRASSPGSKLAQITVEGTSASTTSSVTPVVENSSTLATVEEAMLNNPGKEQPVSIERLSLQPPQLGLGSQISLVTPTRERKVSNIFSKSPTAEEEFREIRQPKKLRKRRLPDSSNPSAQSSTQSLAGVPDSPITQPFYTPLPTPSAAAQTSYDIVALAAPTFSNTDATPVSETPPYVGEGAREVHGEHPANQQATNTGPSQKLSKSPTMSVRSRASITDLSEAFSELDHTDDSVTNNGQEKKKRRWRLSSSARQNNDNRATLSASSQLGTNPIAENSSTSIGSSSKPGKSVKRYSQQQVFNQSAPLHHLSLSNGSPPSKDKELTKKDVAPENTEKKGPIGWFKAKVAQAKEERKEREAEKERAKSPPRNDTDHYESKQSLSAVAQETSQRGRSAGSAENESRPTTTSHDSLS